MNPKSLLTSVILFLTLLVSAQPQPVGNLTIFSEDGDKFFLILNGERQNNTAQTNLRVQDLTQPYYNAKVIFEDKALGEISKNYLQLADVNNVLQDVTYKIKKDNNGKVSLKYFSMAPVQQNYVAPANVTVIRYGNPTPVAATTVTQTTTTHTTGETVGANVNVGGVNMNVTITDPALNTNVQTTTTHTTTTHTTENTAVVQPPRGCNGTYPMSSNDFSSAVSTIKGQGFDETRLSTAKQIAGANCLNTSQISEICKIFGFEETKLDFAKFAYDHCTERSNYFKVNNVFGFSSSVDDLNSYISSKQ